MLFKCIKFNIIHVYSCSYVATTSLPMYSDRCIGVGATPGGQAIWPDHALFKNKAFTTNSWYNINFSLLENKFLLRITDFNAMVNNFNNF